jgi:hypothetical protein
MEVSISAALLAADIDITQETFFQRSHAVHVY